MNCHIQRECPICGSVEFRRLRSYEHAFLVRCYECGLVFSEKVPVKEDLIKHYDAYGRNDYLSPITIARHGEWLDTFEQYRSQNRMLDVGAGVGYFLQSAASRGWEVYGVEFAAKAVDICTSRGITTFQGDLKSAGFPPGFFDIITICEVIEHLDKLRDLIESMAFGLRDGGIVFLTTPNFNSFSRFILRDRWNVIDYPDHLCYFTPRTIRRLFESCYFKLLKIETTGFSLSSIRIAAGESSKHIASTDTDDERLRRLLESGPILRFAKRSLNTLLSILRKGDTIKATFLKQSAV